MSDPSQEDAYGLLALYSMEDSDAGEEILRSVESECVKGPAEAFHAGISKVMYLAHLPLLLYVDAQLRQNAEDRALLEVTGDITPETDKFLQNQEKMLEAMRRAYDDEVRRRKANEDQSQHQLLKCAISISHFMNRYEVARSAVIAGLEAVILGTWTTFEVLSGDLWIGSVNEHPRHLAPLRGTATRISKLAASKPGVAGKESAVASTPNKQPASDGDDESGLGTASDARIPLGKLGLITKGTYDLSNRMGDILVAANCVKFTNLDSIRRAYSSAFSEKKKGVRTDQIDEALSCKDLDNLSHVRNLIVHKAGVADDEYIEKTRGTKLLRLERGQPLVLDGVLVRSLIEPVIPACLELIKGVDRWLSLTKDRKPG